MTPVLIILLLTGVVLTCTIVMARRGAPEAPQTYVESPTWTGAMAGGANTTDLASPAMLVPPPGARFRAGPEHVADEREQLMDDVVNGLQQTPPLPTVLFQVLNELDNRSGSAGSLASIISSEPVLTASLLRAANSASIGLVRRIMSVDEAAAYLGHSTIRGLVLRMQLAKLMPARATGYDSEKLWMHSLAVGQVAAHLARRLGDVETGLVSTIGVLHDIGKLAMSSLFPAAVNRLFEAHGGAADESFLARERRLFGADHAFVGSVLTAQWKLPGELVDAIRFHHTPADAAVVAMPQELRRAVRMVHVANQLVKYSQVYCADMEIDIVPEQLLLELGLPAQLEDLLVEVQPVIQRSSAMCGAAGH